jgi:superfamily II DNA helicase RecQ
MMYCCGCKQCKILAEMLRYSYYHSELSVENKKARVKIWLKSGGWVVTTIALGTRVNYSEIMFILHVGILYGMINYMQELECVGQAGEAADLIILIENRKMQQKAADL